MKRIFLFNFLLICSFSLFAEDAGSMHFWIKATDKTGKPVSGLTNADFKLLVDGKEKPAGCFQEIRSPQKMKLVIAIDGLNTSKYEFLEIRDQLTDFISGLDPSHWQVMVVGVSAGDSAVVVPYTSNFEEATNEIEGIQANEDRDKDIIQRKNLIADEINRDPRRGRARAYQLASSFAQEEAQQVRLTLQGISGIGKHIDPDATGEHIPVLFISGGLNIRPGREYLQLVGQLLGSTSNEEEMEHNLGMSGYDERQEIKKKIGRLSSNITLYTLNIHDPSSGYAGIVRNDSTRFNANDPFLNSDLQEGLNIIASQTGGLVFVGSSDFEKFMAAPQQDASDFYTICFKPDVDKKEKYHDVEINAVKEGIITRYKKGFLTEEP